MDIFHSLKAQNYASGSDVKLTLVHGEGTTTFIIPNASKTAREIWDAFVFYHNTTLGLNDIYVEYDDFEFVKIGHIIQSGNSIASLKLDYNSANLSSLELAKILGFSNVSYSATGSVTINAVSNVVTLPYWGSSRFPTNLDTGLSNIVSCIAMTELLIKETQKETYVTQNAVSNSVGVSRFGKIITIDLIPYAKIRQVYDFVEFSKDAKIQFVSTVVSLQLMNNIAQIEISGEDTGLGSWTYEEEELANFKLGLLEV